MRFALYWFVIGSLVFLIYADFYFLHHNEPLDPARNVWDDLYYVWDMAKDLLVLFVIRKLIDDESQKVIKPLFYYCSIRLLWAMTTPFTGWDRNHPLMVTMAFTLLMTCVVFWLIRNLRQFQRKDL